MNTPQHSVVLQYRPLCSKAMPCTWGQLQNDKTPAMLVSCHPQPAAAFMGKRIWYRGHSSLDVPTSVEVHMVVCICWHLPLLQASHRFLQGSRGLGLVVKVVGHKEVFALIQHGLHSGQ